MASMSKKASKKQVNKDASALPPGGDVDHVDDTDDEMFPEDRPHSSLPSREKRRRERDVKAKPKEMTEEEMMDLALRLSEQEATMAAVKRQQEDEAMKEALKMFSQTQPCASPQSYYSNRDPSPKLLSRRKLAYPAVACDDVVLVEDLTTETNGEPNTRGAGNHKHGKRKRKREDGGPLLELPDLSQTQKICSDSLTLDSQPNGVNHGDEESESNPTATLAGKERQTKSDEDSLPESMKITRDTNSRWSDDGKDLASKKSPSPVVGEERRLQRAGDQRQSPGSSVRPGTSGLSLKSLRLSRLLPPEMSDSDTTITATTTTTCPQYPQSRAGPSHTQQLCVRPEWPRGQPLVHYYWGVPFCPRGLDPDEYTQAILAQMEVYEKSLKLAQRSLLKKARWGDGIIPKTEEPLDDSPELIRTRRSRKKRRGEKLREEEEEEEEEEEDGGGKEPDPEVEVVEEGEEDLDVVGCDVCPETQLSGDDTQERVMDTNAGEESQADSPSLLQVHSPPRTMPPSMGGGEEEGEGEEEDLTKVLDKKEEAEQDDMDPALRRPPLRRNNKSPHSVFVLKERRDKEGGASEQPAVMSPSREQQQQEEVPGQEEEEEEEGALDVVVVAAAAASPVKAASTVDCPICQRAFHSTEIVMHAAFCDGEQDVVECADDPSPVSLRPAKRRTLTSLATEEESSDGDASGQARASRGRERCYVCHKSVPLAEYPRHTEACIQRRQQAHAAPGDLLSALETTDARDPAGPSASNATHPAREVIDLSVNEDDEDEDGGSGQSSTTFAISNSPIRAFRSISEASDCLVDFRRQSAPRQPSHRPRGRGGGGVKRKFKRR